MRLTVTFNRLTAPVLWAWLGLFRQKQFCHGCGMRVRPRNLGGLMKEPGDKIVIWHNRLPCIIDYVEYNNITELSQKETDGKPKS